MADQVKLTPKQIAEIRDSRKGQVPAWVEGAAPSIKERPVENPGLDFIRQEKWLNLPEVQALLNQGMTVQKIREFMNQPTAQKAPDQYMSKYYAQRPEGYVQPVLTPEQRAEKEAALQQIPREPYVEDRRMEPQSVVPQQTAPAAPQSNGWGVPARRKSPWRPLKKEDFI